MHMRHNHFRKFVQYLDIGRVYPSSYTELKRRTNEKHERKKKDQHILRNPGTDISFPIFIRKESETRKLERKSKQKISRFNDILYRLNDIISR